MTNANLKEHIERDGYFDIKGVGVDFELQACRMLPYPRVIGRIVV